MKQCKCEHWQQCPVCMPHRFNAEGNRLPPETTPLQSARAEIEALNQRLSKLQNAAQGALDALEGVLDRNPGEKILEMTITGGLYEVVQVKDAITSLQCALSAPYSDIKSYGGMDPRNKCEQVAEMFELLPKEREWQSLTDEEIVEIAATPAAIPGAYVHCFARAIEAKLKEKNT